MGTEVFSLGFWESHPLSESSPCISHSKMLPLGQPRRASQTTRLECVRHSRRPKSERLDPASLLHFFPKMYIFTRARNQGTRFGKWIRKVHVCNLPNAFCWEILHTLHLIQRQETLPVHSFTPCFAAENSQSDSEEQGSGEGSPRHRGSPAGLSTQLLRTARGFLSTLDFRPHRPLTSGLTLLCLILVVTLGALNPERPWARRATRQAGSCGPSAHSTKYPCPPPGTFRFFIHFLPPISYPNQLLQALCFLFRRDFCSLTGRWLTILSPEHLFLELAGLGCNRCSEKGDYTAVRVLWNPIQYISKLFLQTSRSSIKFISLIHNPGISISLKSVY